MKKVYLNQGEDKTIKILSYFYFSHFKKTCHTSKIAECIMQTN